MTSEEMRSHLAGQKMQELQAPVCFAPGTIVDGRFEILQLLGKGGMSIVYKARYLALDRVVVLKMLHAHLLVDRDAVERFQREAAAATALSHPHINAALAFGVWEGQPYLVLDYLEGKTLASLLKERGYLPAAVVVGIFLQICDALSYAVERDVIHADLKPSNIFLLDGGNDDYLVKLVDFGIAKILPKSGRKLQSLTQSGELSSTVLRMSPEQCIAQPVDSRSDIYALGCLMYEALAGRPPFVGDNAGETMSGHLHKSAESFETFCPDKAIGRDLEAIVFRALEKNPQDRFQSASELARALSSARVVQAKPPLPEACVPEGKPGRKRLVAKLLVVSWFLLAGISLVVCFREARHAFLAIPQHAMEHYLEAQSCLDKDECSKAQREIDEAISIRGDDWKAYFLRAKINGRLKEYKAALGDLTEALRLNPRNSQLYALRGDMCLKLGHLALSIQDFSQVLEIDPSDSESWSQRGVAYEKQGQFALAVTDFDQSIKLSPCAGTYLSRAEAYNQLKEYDKALADTDSAVRLDPTLAEAHYVRFLVQINRGHRDLAEEQYREAVKLGFHPEGAQEGDTAQPAP